MADNDKAAAPKPRAKTNSVSFDDKERGKEAAAAVQGPRPDPFAPAIDEERRAEPGKKPKAPSVEAGDLPEAVRKGYYADKA